MDFIALMRTPQPGAAPKPTGVEEADKAARAAYQDKKATYEQALEAVQHADFLVNSDTPAGERAQKEVVRSLQRLEALGEDRVAAALWPTVRNNPAYRRYWDPEGYAAEQGETE